MYKIARYIASFEPHGFTAIIAVSQTLNGAYIFAIKFFGGKRFFHSEFFLYVSN